MLNYKQETKEKSLGNISESLRSAYISLESVIIKFEKAISDYMNREIPKSSELYDEWKSFMSEHKRFSDTLDQEFLNNSKIYKLTELELISQMSKRYKEISSSYSTLHIEDKFSSNNDSKYMGGGMLILAKLKEHIKGMVEENVRLFNVLAQDNSLMEYHHIKYIGRD